MGTEETWGSVVFEETGEALVLGETVGWEDMVFDLVLEEFAGTMVGWVLEVFGEIAVVQPGESEGN